MSEQYFSSKSYRCADQNKHENILGSEKFEYELSLEKFSLSSLITNGKKFIKSQSIIIIYCVCCAMYIKSKSQSIISITSKSQLISTNVGF